MVYNKPEVINRKTGTYIWQRLKQRPNSQ